MFSKTVSLLSLILFSVSVSAVDVPQDSLGAQQLDNQKCTDEANQTCINDRCLNSDEIDCQEQCHKLAEESCQQQLNE